MDEILNCIETKSEQLAKNPFCQWILYNNHDSDEATFSFSPSMLYFILGFRDILNHLEYANPQTELEKIINQHCLEDKNHWKWYLQDLKTLGVCKASWGGDWPDFVDKVWHDESKPTRDLVYLCIHLIKKHQSPKASLVIIECLESTFGVFMSTLQNKFKNSDIYSRLHFFGQLHQEQEMNHSLGHWIEADNEGSANHSLAGTIANIQVSAEENRELIETVNLIFDQFELVFSTWLKLKKTYTKPNFVIPVHKLSRENNDELNFN